MLKFDRVVSTLVALILAWLTPHIGIINDFSWNVVNGSHNNFEMVRSGIDFAF